MKRYFYSRLLILLAFTTGLGTAHAQTRLPHAKLLSVNVPHVSPMVPVAIGAPAAAPVVLAGRVETLDGPLPGAVVRLPRLNQSCVTDAQGTFRFTVPAGTGPEAVVTSYAGFADATDTLQPGATLAVVQLLTPVSISLTKHQQLKAYLKTARHEVKHDLRQIK